MFSAIACFAIVHAEMEEPLGHSCGYDKQPYLDSKKSQRAKH